MKLKTANVVEQLFDLGEHISISPVTEIELFSHPNMNAYEAEAVEKFLNLISSVVLDSKIARLAGRLRSQNRITLADSAIAATAIIFDAALLTRNIKDFQKIPGLKLKKI